MLSVFRVLDLLLLFCYTCLSVQCKSTLISWIALCPYIVLYGDKFLHFHSPCLVTREQQNKIQHFQLLLNMYM